MCYVLAVLLPHQIYGKLFLCILYISHYQELLHHCTHCNRGDFLVCHWDWEEQLASSSHRLNWTWRQLVNIDFSNTIWLCFARWLICKQSAYAVAHGSNCSLGLDLLLLTPFVLLTYMSWNHFQGFLSKGFVPRGCLLVKLNYTHTCMFSFRAPSTFCASHLILSEIYLNCTCTNAYQKVWNIVCWRS